MLQRHTVQKLHHDIRLTVFLADVVNGANVGMIERGVTASDWGKKELPARRSKSQDKDWELYLRPAEKVRGKQ